MLELGLVRPPLAPPLSLLLGLFFFVVVFLLGFVVMSIEFAPSPSLCFGLLGVAGPQPRK
jgi:hypothetical protein